MGVGMGVGCWFAVVWGSFIVGVVWGNGGIGLWEWVGDVCVKIREACWW